ncbi:hypothetical protein DSO57_1008174 [Entomophthora muscae]|uniref:Uncharacterized protein n=1 Tax=Entomophthora muscae TaxID=34485 RepID=A0ACC2T704_9FUNG|nr:hypothetical protein DSO57_1008174 [Entomophthora muscae]
MLFFFFAALVVCQQRCAQIDDRREIRDLEPSERHAFFEAINTLAKTGGIPSNYDRIVRIHVETTAKIHKSLLFLPWHRHYVHHLQAEIRKLNPSVVIPYWDTAFDSQQPEKSEIFTPEFLGGTGTPETGYCVPNGPFANLEIRVEDDKPDNTVPGCLLRAFDGGEKLTPFATSEVIQKISATKDFAKFSSQIERGPHAPIHNGIGSEYGHMSTMSSPNDPIFWLHHANVDYWYFRWQQSVGKNNYVQGKEGTALPYYDDVTVRDTLDTEAYPYCYRYAPKGTKIHPPTNQTELLPPNDQDNIEPPVSNNGPEQEEQELLPEEEPPFEDDIPDDVISELIPDQREPSDDKPVQVISEQDIDQEKIPEDKPVQVISEQDANQEQASKDKPVQVVSEKDFDQDEPQQSDDEQVKVVSEKDFEREKPHVSDDRQVSERIPDQPPLESTQDESYRTEMPQLLTIPSLILQMKVGLLKQMGVLARRQDSSETISTSYNQDSHHPIRTITPEETKLSQELIIKIKEACPPSVCPDALDRNDLRRLRVPRPIPLRWIILNNLGIKETRQQEIAFARLLFKLNSDPNYQSPESIGKWNFRHPLDSSTNQTYTFSRKVTTFFED